MAREWLIHRFECPNCGATTRADREVNCFRCTTRMEKQEHEIGEVTDVAE